MPPLVLLPGILLRPIESDDADALVRAYVRNRDHLARWDPRRADEFFTPEFQRSLITRNLEDCEAGRGTRFVLAAASEASPDRGDEAVREEIVGSVTVSNVVLGSLRSASVGYWIDAAHLARGLATASLEAVCSYAEHELGLHRLEAGTLLHNVRSQRVLAKCGFRPYGVAEEFLYIDGRWQDHRLFQRILNDLPA